MKKNFDQRKDQMKTKRRHLPDILSFIDLQQSNCFLEATVIWKYERVCTFEVQLISDLFVLCSAINLPECI